MDVIYGRTLSRFYYSLIISVLMHKRQALVSTPQGRKSHVNGWLNNARRRQLFSKVVLRDIEWLLKQNTILHPDVLEAHLLTIYRSSQFLCLTAGVSSYRDTNNQRCNAL